MAMLPEDRVLKPIIDYLTEHKIYFERRNATGLNYRKGIPDLWCVINGKHIEIETKREDGLGKLSSMQIKWKSRLEKFNVTYWYADSFEVFLEYIDAEMNSHNP